MSTLETHTHKPGDDPIPGETLEFIRAVRERVALVVVGQDVVVERLLIALVTGGHLLLQGVPGLAKTLLVATLSKTIDLQFARIQFTVDLLPSDIIGSEILDQKTNDFRVHKGPIFTNLLLADEINRAAPKVQSALLEAMQERRVTIGNETFRLPAPFLVIATQNPIEQSGTFELPEAQLDRFMLCHRLAYPHATRRKRSCGATPPWEFAARTVARSRAPSSTCLKGVRSPRPRIWFAPWRPCTTCMSAKRSPITWSRSSPGRGIIPGSSWGPVPERASLWSRGRERGR